MDRQDGDPKTLESAFASCAAGEWERARDLFVAALDGAGSAPPDAYESLAFCYFRLGQLPQAARTLERAFLACVNDGQARRAVRVAAQLVAVHEILGAGAAAHGWEQRGLRLLEDLDPCIERGYLALARTGCVIHDPAELEERAELALQLARQFGARDLELRARADKGLALVSRGYVDAGFTLLDESMVAISAGEMQDEEMRGKAACAMLSACERTGDAGRAEYWCARIEEDPRLQHVLVLAHCSVTYGAVQALRGRWDEAEARLVQAMQIAGSAYHRALSVARLAQVRVQQGRYREAAELLAGYEDDFETAFVLAQLRLAEGQVEQAAGLLRSAVRGLGGDCIRLAPVLALQIQVELQRDALPAAERAARQLGSLEARCESNEIRAYARLGAGMVARYDGDYSLAIEELETALTLLLHYDRPLLRAEVRLELARALHLAGDAASARVEAQAALATLQRLGLVPASDAAARLLQSIGAPAALPAGVGAGMAGGGRDARPGGELTARENEVAALVARGLTNREIAERLVLSVRTVEGHIDRILGKLDFHTRSQLAGWVAGASQRRAP
jgi:DNA-binding CsgD family transcriptional regulator